MSLLNPWLLLGLVLAFAGVGYGGYTKGKAAQLAVDTAALQTERLEASENAAKAKEGWLAMVAARDADIAALQSKQVAESATFQSQLAVARRATEATTREVNRVTREKPIAASCALSDERLGLRNRAIREANATADGTTETAAGGLSGVIQGYSARDSGVADWGAERDLSGGRLDHQDLWRIPTYTHSAG